jgi:PPOX class probable FMN-dependent enzyme
MATVEVRSKDELREHYEQPSETIVKLKSNRLDRHARHFMLGTLGDVSPKGDAPGFVQVVDDTTLLIPDRPGNNRLDSLGNLLDDPTVGLLFFVPGFNETLRINGTAHITTQRARLAPLAVRGKVPKAAIEVAIVEAYFHCGKALIRSKLWDPQSQVERKSFPAMGQIVADQIAGLDAAEIEDGYQTALRERLY